MEYKKSTDGNHFYRINDAKNILHVFHGKEDSTVVQEQDNLTMITEIKKDDCCINLIHELRETLIDCSKEEFENKAKEVIFILGIYEFCEHKQN